MTPVNSQQNPRSRFAYLKDYRYPNHLNTPNQTTGSAIATLATHTSVLDAAIIRRPGSPLGATLFAPWCAREHLTC